MPVLDSGSEKITVETIVESMGGELNGLLDSCSRARTCWEGSQRDG